MRKYFVAFGTRPELIKLVPIISELRKNSCEVVICNTGQHKEMLTPLLNFFKIAPHYDLQVMKDQQSLTQLTSNILNKVESILITEKPDIVVVQGDTTTAFTISLAAFYQKIKIAHVEAGLRTGDIYSPFPEEANRKFISQITNWHFAPTEIARTNLLNENIHNNVFVTGNTSIDTLRLTTDLISGEEFTHNIYNHFPRIKDAISKNQKLILVTIHRRENHGEPLELICESIKQVSQLYSDFDFIIPVHMNPSVQKVLTNKFKNNNRVHLLPPLDYPIFIWMMKHSFFIMTDSGGVQEEAPYLKKPILVLRENTERPEGITARTALLVGHNISSIIETAQKLITDSNFYSQFVNAHNPYGDGLASERIVKEIT